MSEPTKESNTDVAPGRASALCLLEEYTNEYELPVTGSSPFKINSTHSDESIVVKTISTIMNNKNHDSVEVNFDRRPSFINRKADIGNINDDESNVVQRKGHDELPRSSVVSTNSAYEDVASRSQINYNLRKYRSDLSDSCDNTDSSDTESNTAISEDNEDDSDDSLGY